MLLPINNVIGVDMDKGTRHRGRSELYILEERERDPSLEKSLGTGNDSRVLIRVSAAGFSYCRNR